MLYDFESKLKMPPRNSSKQIICITLASILVCLCPIQVKSFLIRPTTSTSTSTSTYNGAPSLSLPKIPHRSQTMIHLSQEEPFLSDSSMEGCICLVTGASRGIGKGIAIELGKAGATVYITGTSSSSQTSKDSSSLFLTNEVVGGPGSETIEETAAEITKAGGEGIPGKNFNLCASF